MYQQGLQGVEFGAVGDDSCQKRGTLATRVVPSMRGYSIHLCLNAKRRVRVRVTELVESVLVYNPL